jgi:hypothetical protein
MTKTSEWFCVNDECRRHLGSVLGGEFHPAEDIGGQHMQTRGPNLVITCPECATPKVWYTADPITRALYQLVDAISTQAARRMISKVSELTLDKEK